MSRLPRILITRLLPAALCFSALGPAGLAQTSLRQIRVLGSRDAVEIEVEASDRIVPQTQVLSGPDRLVIDFPNAVPGAGLRNQSVQQGEVKDIRFGLFQAKPPVTRVVIDLKSAQSFQVFPGHTVIIKVAGGGADITATQGGNDPRGYSSRPGLIATNYTRRAERISVPAAPAPAPEKPLDVSFRDGMLRIKANKATLSEVLFAVQQRTGAEIGIVAGAEQEKVVVDLGPASAPEVLQQLLNGSHFNFLIVSAQDNPQKLERVILSPRVEGMYVSRAPVVAAQVAVPVQAVNENPQEQEEDNNQPAQAEAPQPPPTPQSVPMRPPPPVGPRAPDSHPEIVDPNHPPN